MLRSRRRIGTCELFGPVVLALALDVLGAEAQLPGRGTVGPQPVGHQLLRRHALLLQQLTQQSEGSSLVTMPLHQHVEDLALAVDGPPQIHGPTGDLHEHLVQMSTTARRTATAPQAPGEQWPEARDPDPDGLVGDDDAALGQQLLDVAQAQASSRSAEPAQRADRRLDMRSRS